MKNKKEPYRIYRILASNAYKKQTLSLPQNVREEVNIKPLRCQRCSHKWEHTGQNPYFTLCPHCRTTVRISRRKVQKCLVGINIEV